MKTLGKKLVLGLVLISAFSCGKKGADDAAVDPNLAGNQTVNTASVSCTAGTACTFDKSFEAYRNDVINDAFAPSLKNVQYTYYKRRFSVSNKSWWIFDFTSSGYDYDRFERESGSVIHYETGSSSTPLTTKAAVKAHILNIIDSIASSSSANFQAISNTKFKIGFGDPNSSYATTYEFDLSLPLEANPVREIGQIEGYYLESVQSL